MRARRLALLLWGRYVGRTQVDMAAALGLSAQGASSLLRRRTASLAALRELTEGLAEVCWERAGPAQQADDA